MSSSNFKPADPPHRDEKGNRLPTPITTSIRDDKTMVVRGMTPQIISVPGRDEKSLNIARMPQTLSTPDIVKASTIAGLTGAKAVVTKPLIPVPQSVTHTLHIGVPKVSVGSKPMLNPVMPLQTQVTAIAAKSQMKPKQKGILNMQDVRSHHPGHVTIATMPSHTQPAVVSSIQQVTTGHPQPLVSPQIPTSLTHNLASQLHHGAQHAGMIPSIITASQKAAMPQRVATPPQSHLVGNQFPSHVPRGAAAASALNVPKGSVATAVRPSITPTSDQHRTIVSSHPTTCAPSVQITIQQSARTMDLQHRPVLPQYTGSHAAPTTAKTVHLPQPQQKLIISTSPHGAVGPHQTITTVAIPKSVASLVSTSSSGVVLATTTAAAPVSIPIAKVHPQRQLMHPAQTSADFTRTEANVASTTQGLFLSQAHRGAATTMASVPLTTTHTDTRSTLPQVLNTYHRLPAGSFSGFEYMTSYHQGMPAMQYSHIAGSQPSFVAASTGSSTRQVTPSQTPNLAATLQAHNNAATTATAVKMTPVMVSMEPKPPRQLSIRSPQYTAATEVTHGISGGDSNLITTSTPGQLLGFAAQQASTLMPSNSQNNTTTNLNASPRPSILRKRPNDGQSSVVKKSLNLSDSAASSPKLDSGPMSAASSPKPLIDACSRENSQSSTDTASSAENSNQSPPVAMQTTEVKVKQEPMETTENGLILSSGATTPAISQSNSMEASPRKKPRKQLLNANEELKDEPVSYSSGDNIDDLLDTSFENDGDKDSFIDDEGTRWVNMRRRNQVALLNFYSCTWKAKNNHFYRQADVKIKDERRPTVNELSNQKGIMQKTSGWKLYHLAAQLEDMNDCEKDVKSKMGGIQDSLIPKGKHSPLIDEEMSRVHDLTQGNIQRSQLIVDQLEEARSSMIKILDHKQKIMEIVNKHHSKRPVKKKERS
ncbi:histone deacetylase complex subunit SAP130-like [Lineus longissimus]|uniref:histone deacetylase complex subunit SAP130-like n=1 Tax=Lineus longissimus TaxID=88925 RepID=UPI00315DBC4C